MALSGLHRVETPTFSRLVAQNRIEKAPALEVIKRQPKEIILTALARMGQQAPFYIFASFVFTYGVTFLHSSRDLLLTALLAAAALSFFYAVALYILFCAVVSIVSTSLLPDYTNRDISQEHA